MKMLLLLAALLFPGAAITTATSAAPHIPEKTCVSVSSVISELLGHQVRVISHNDDRVVFRVVNMIAIAEFDNGCLAALGIVGRAPADVTA